MSVSIRDEVTGAPSGHFRLEIFRKGELVDVFEEKNLVVVGSKQTHARLLGGDVTNRSVTKISYGTSLTEPAEGNTSITNAFTKSIDSVSYPATNQVRFAFSLGASEANGKAIGEFGLLTAGNVLYARKTRAAALQKESDISLSGTWTITF